MCSSVAFYRNTLICHPEIKTQNVSHTLEASPVLHPSQYLNQEGTLLLTSLTVD